MHLWADRFDGELQDIFDLQDKVTSSLGMIAPTTLLACFFAGRHDEAVSWELRALRGHPDGQAYLGLCAASQAAAGQIEGARKTVTRRPSARSSAKGLES